MSGNGNFSNRNFSSQLARLYGYRDEISVTRGSWDYPKLPPDGVLHALSGSGWTFCISSFFDTFLLT